MGAFDDRNITDIRRLSTEAADMGHNKAYRAGRSVLLS